MLQRVLFRLSARRGSFPFREDLGSDLWKLGSITPSARQSAAEQAVAEALADEDGLQVESVALSGGADGAAQVTVCLSWQGTGYTVGVTVE